MELPDLGQHCAFKNCKQLDFLPLQCKCGLIFCSEHFSNHSSTCSCVNIENQPNLDDTSAQYVCSHPSCNSRSYLPLICEKCNQHFCVVHRHIAECEAKDPEVKAAELKKFTTPVEEFNQVKKEVDKQIDQSISQARKNPKTSQMANKIQLMRIKNKATGSKTIPTTDRIYFTIQYPKSLGSKTSSVFVAKTWTLGRVIDAVAQECKVKNNNNQTNALKLRLFHKLSGNILSVNLTCKMEALLSEQSLIDGEDLILEYVSDECLHLEM